MGLAYDRQRLAMHIVTTSLSELLTQAQGEWGQGQLPSRTSNWLFSPIKSVYPSIGLEKADEANIVEGHSISQADFMATPLRSPWSLGQSIKSWDKQITAGFLYLTETKTSKTWVLEFSFEFCQYLVSSCTSIEVEMRSKPPFKS